MGYKDKDRQRQANKQAQAKFKAKAKGITEGITEQGITEGPVIPKTKAEIIAEVRAMSAAEVKTMLDGWAETKGTIYQYRLAMLGRQRDAEL